MLTKTGQQSGYVGHPVDVWSSGVTLCALATALRWRGGGGRMIAVAGRALEPEPCAVRVCCARTYIYALHRYAMLAGCLPFEHANPSSLYKKIIAGQFHVPPFLSRRLAAPGGPPSCPKTPPCPEALLNVSRRVPNAHVFLGSGGSRPLSVPARVCGCAQGEGGAPIRPEHRSGGEAGHSTDPRPPLVRKRRRRARPGTCSGCAGVPLDVVR